jgi:predicted dehydrogenase
VEDVVFVTLGYPGGAMAHLHVSWLDPLKTRRVTVVGGRKMLVYDDLDVNARLKIFDKGADRGDPSPNTFGLWHYRLRDGAVDTPVLDDVEPLAAEVEHFLACVENGERPLTDGWNGVRVVAVCEAVDASLAADGARITVSVPQPTVAPPPVAPSVPQPGVLKP